MVSKFILIAIVVLLVLLAVLITIFPPICICGISMMPTLNDGDTLIGIRVFRKTKCKIGEIYVFKPPHTEDKEVKYVIKRLTDIKDGKYYFMGDNRNHSYDSRAYGYVEPSRVVAHIKLKGGNKNGY